MEKTLLMVKPDGVQRGLVGKVLQRFEDKGFHLIAAKMMQISAEQAANHYDQHKHKLFYSELIDFITSGPVFVFVVQGNDAIGVSRMMIGQTKPKDAHPGTIRGDFALHPGNNLIHGSDSQESAEREIANLFASEELIAYERTLLSWIDPEFASHAQLLN